MCEQHSILLACSIWYPVQEGRACTDAGISGIMTCSWLSTPLVRWGICSQAMLGMQGDTVGMERGDLQQELIGLTVVQRLQPVTVPLPLASHHPRSSLSSLGSTRTTLQRTVAGEWTFSLHAHVHLLLQQRAHLLTLPQPRDCLCQRRPRHQVQSYMVQHALQTPLLIFPIPACAM